MAVLVHIGYRKTASTWLQRGVFPNMAEVEYVPESDSVMAAMLRSIAGTGPSPFLPDAFTSLLAERERSAGKPLLLSFEGLSGNVFGKGLDGVDVADRIRSIIPDARILIIVRRQQDMITSLYCQYVQEGGFRDFDSFVAGEQLPGCRFARQHLEYHPVVERYREHYDENVFTIPYELLSDDPGAFMDSLRRWGGVSSLGDRGSRNPSLSWPLVRLLRSWNRLFRRSAYNPRPPVAIPVNPRSVLQRKADPLLRRAIPRVNDLHGPPAPDNLVASYRESNRVLEKLVGKDLDLAALGYRLAD